MQAQVLHDGESSTPFPVTNGVKQGCVLAPTLFSIMFSAMLTDAFQDTDPGINIRYRTDGKLFNLRRLQAKTKVHVDKLREFLFADDCALNADNIEDMQRSMDLFSAACNNFGLTINTKKTEVIYQPAPHKSYQKPTVTVNGQKLAAVDKFTYLGVPSLAVCTLMMRWIPESPRPALPSVVCDHQCGNANGSASQPS